MPQSDTLFLHPYSSQCMGYYVYIYAPPNLPPKIYIFIAGYWSVLSPTSKETSFEASQGRARFQQHRDASCHQVFNFLCKTRRRRKFKPFWQKHQFFSFLVGLRRYQHPCTQRMNVFHKVLVLHSDYFCTRINQTVFVRDTMWNVRYEMHISI